jgi:branched-chain amino acid transport system substrate-binding protein
MNFIGNMDEIKKVLLGITSLLVLLVVSTVLYLYLERSKPIRLGFIGTISGKYGGLGSTARDGALMAVEEINDAGGINGRRLELIILDDEGDPSQAADHARSLGSQGIRFIIGPFLTASGTSILPIVNKGRILTISGTTMGQNLAGQDDYYLVLIPTTGYYGGELVTIAVKQGHKRFAVISDSRNDPYCTTFLNGVRSILDIQNGTSLNEVTFKTSSNVLYSKITGELDLDRTDAVFLCSSALDTALLAQNIKKRREDISLFSTSWAISSELVQNGGASVEGLLFLQSIDSSDASENYLKFKERYENRFNQSPTFVAIFNYEAVVILKNCLSEGRTSQPIRVKELILKKGEQWGVQRNFRLDKNGDAIRPLILHTVKNGEFVPEDPP